MLRLLKKCWNCSREPLAKEEHGTEVCPCPCLFSPCSCFDSLAASVLWVSAIGGFEVTVRFLVDLPMNPMNSMVDLLATGCRIGVLVHDEPDAEHAGMYHSKHLPSVVHIDRSKWLLLCSIVGSHCTSKGSDDFSTDPSLQQYGVEISNLPNDAWPE